MKHILRASYSCLLPAFALFCSSFCACTTSSDFQLSEITPVESDPSVILYPTTISADAAGGSYKVSVAATAPWTVEIEGDCSVSPMSGNASVHELQILLGPNNSPDIRAITVSVCVKGASMEANAMIAVTQPTSFKPGIGSLSDLKELAMAVNAGQAIDKWMNQEGVIYQTADIDFSGVTTWMPIGTYNAAFAGIFDGNGFQMLNCNFTQGSEGELSCFGIFGCNGGTIRNVKVAGKKVQATVTAGAVCGLNMGGRIENCENRTEVEVTSGAYNAAGICGTNRSCGVISGCKNYGAVTGSSWAGGICGQNGVNNELENTVTIGCENHGVVTSRASAAGGICGMNFSTIENAVNQGGVVGYSNAGGISGLASSPGVQGGIPVRATIKKCRNEGNVSGNGNWNGGIVGSCSGGDVVDCSNSGKVSGVATVDSNSQWAGGIVGTALRTSIVAGCSNSGTVYSPGNYCGGIVGYCNASYVDECINAQTGLVRGSGAYIGGVVADSYYATVTKCKNYGTAEVAAESDNGQPHSIGGIVGYNYRGIISDSDYKQGKPAVICGTNDGDSPVS